MPDITSTIKSIRAAFRRYMALAEAALSSITGHRHMDRKQLLTLEGAISDVGYWCRWTAALPDSVQLEFGGVQLATGEGAELRRPIHPLIVRFLRPSNVVFIINSTDWLPVMVGRGDVEPEPSDQVNVLRRGPAPVAALPADWASLLERGEVGPFGIDSDRFTFQDVRDASAILAEVHEAQVLIGGLPTAQEWSRSPSRLAFWAGAVGAIVMADGLEMMAETVPIAGGDLERMHRDWFVYWKEYWRRRGQQDALPQDWACEVTIPGRGALD